MPEKDKLVIWPIYFDVRRSRSEGRMVSVQDAVKEPTVESLVAAAIESGLKPEIERKKRHPKTWHESSGRILIHKDRPKSIVLKKIAGSLKSRKE